MTNGRQRTENWRRWPARSTPRPARTVAPPPLADEPDPYSDAEGDVVHMVADPVTTTTDPVELSKAPPAVDTQVDDPDMAYWLRPVPPLNPDVFAAELAVKVN